MNYEAMLYRAAEDRRMYELEQQARWLHQQHLEQQRQQFMNERPEWRRGDSFTMLHQEQQQSTRLRDGWHGESQQYSNRPRDAWQGGAQAQRVDGAARGDQCPPKRLLKKRRVLRAESSCDQPDAASGKDCSDSKKTCVKEVATSRVNKEGSPLSPAISLDSCRKEKEWSEVRKEEDCSEVRKEKQFSEVSSRVDGVDGQAAGGEQVGNPKELTVGNALISSDMAKHEESCQHLVTILCKGPSYLLNEVSLKELISVQHSARSIVELVDDALLAAVQRDLRSLAAEKEEISRQRDADRLAMESEASKMKQDQEAEILGLKHAHEFALSRQKQDQENLRTQLEKEQHKAVCKICLTKPRDAVLLPCMHFDYCGQCLLVHQNNHNTCPSCRCSIQGVLNCNLGV